MKQSNPNRDRKEIVKDHQRQKQSGDQHILPADEPAQDPHRPHRVSREDMQKLRPTEPDSDEPKSP